MTRFQPHYNNNLIKIVMPATYFLRVSCTSFIWYNATLKWHLKTREMQILFCLMLKNQGNFHTLLVVSGHVQVKVLLAATEFFKTSFFYWLHSFAYDTVIMHHKRLQASIKNIENIKLFLRGQQTAKSLHLCSTCYFFQAKIDCQCLQFCHHATTFFSVLLHFSLHENLLWESDFNFPISFWLCCKGGNELDFKEAYALIMVRTSSKSVIFSKVEKKLNSFHTSNSKLFYLSLTSDFW